MVLNCKISYSETEFYEFSSDLIVYSIYTAPSASFMLKISKYMTWTDNEKKIFADLKKFFSDNNTKPNGFTFYTYDNTTSQYVEVYKAPKNEVKIFLTNGKDGKSSSEVYGLIKA